LGEGLIRVLGGTQYVTDWCLDRGGTVFVLIVYFYFLYRHYGLH
jgi:hypothetical protein